MIVLKRNCDYRVSLVYCFLFLIFYIEYQFVNDVALFTNWYLFQLLLLCFVSLWHSIKRFGLHNLYSLLLISITLFWFSGLFISIFYPDFDYREMSSFINISISEKNMQKTLILYSVFLAGLNVITGVGKAKRETFSLETNTCYLKLGKFLMLSMFVFALYKAKIEFTLLVGNRSSLFLDGNSSLNIPIYIRAFSNLFRIGFLFIIASVPSKGDFIKYSLLYIITLVPSLGFGNRMLFALTILYIIWYVGYVYKCKFNAVKIILFAVGLVVLFQVIALMRTGDNSDSYSLLFLFALFFISQSISFYILPLYMESMSHLGDYPYPFVCDAFFAGFIQTSGQSIDTLSHRANLGHQLVYYLNPDYYLSGYSLGTSSIAELYEFGIWSVFIGSVLLAFFIFYFQNKVISSHLLLFLSFVIVTSIVSSPRNSYFISLFNLVRDTSMFFFCKYAWIIYAKCKNR